MNGAHGILAPSPAKLVSADPPTGSFQNLRVDNVSGSESTKIGITATSIVLANSRFETISARSVSVVIDSALAGAGGVESGSAVSGSNWYARHIIANPWTGQVNGLLSTSATAPILPAGYEFSAFTGWHRSSSGNFHRIMQRGRRAQYVVSAAVTTTAMVIKTGAHGDTSVPTYVATSVSSVVPTTAVRISGSFGGTGNGLLAPNGLYGAINSTTNPAPINFSGGGTVWAGSTFDFVLESTNLYSASSSTCVLAVTGWEEG